MGACAGVMQAQFISCLLAFYQVPQIRVLEGKWREREEERVLASFCFLAFLGSEAPVWTFSSAVALILSIVQTLSTPQSNLIVLSQMCQHQLNDASSSDLWFQYLWDRFNELLGSDRPRFFSLLLQLGGWELLSCRMIQCFLLSAFNICLTDPLYVPSVETLSVVCVFLTGSWLICCTPRFPS